MRNALACLTLGLLSFATYADEGRWIKVLSGERQTIFVDKRSLKVINGQVVSGWTMQVFKRPQPSHRGPFRAVKVEAQWNCKARTAQRIQLVAYADADTTRDILSQGAGPSEAVVPESVGETVLDHVCSRLKETLTDDAGDETRNRSPKDSGTAYWVALGQRYEHGEGVQRDLARAEQLYCKAARADNADGLIRLGWMYMNGRGVDRDHATAHALFKHAARLGHEMGDRLADLVQAGPHVLPACLKQSS